MFYLKLWFYLLSGVPWGPFNDPAVCQAMADRHGAMVQEIASPCFEGWDERAYVMLREGGSWS